MANRFSFNPAVAITLGLALASCKAGQYDYSQLNTPLPGQNILRAYSPKTDEVFTGRDRGTGPGRGEVIATSNKGRRCVGQVRFKLDFSGGHGRFKCESGERGRFVFYRQGRSGFGCGQFETGPRYYSTYGEVVARNGRRATEADCVKAIEVVGANKLKL